ncbi:MAG: Gfo/Idh/MocA family oxidoreductase [Thermoguttaceae bacterium]|nr:Gfo/Idh/MocA family oxidoreductase [Thermoguttaceae bacterium]
MSRINRRAFLKSAAFAGAGLGFAGAFPAPAFCQDASPNSKLNLAHVGLAGMQGDFHRGSCSGENRVAICDVDEKYLEKYGAEMPDAKKYVDFREMYAEMGDKIDAVVITTPDHAHAKAAVEAMKLGIACYCEKPLAHDVYQIRQMRKLAREKGLATQMGTQIHAGDNYRRVVELVQSGAIGKISRVDVWCGVVWGRSPRTTDAVDVPAGLHWDLWLAGAPERPYQPCYFGGNWRSFWDFGNGGMGDMGCHFMDLVFWALDLQYPKTIEAFHASPADADFAPRDLRVEYVFPGVKGTTDELAVSWCDGSVQPESLKKYGVEQGNGVLFIGEEGAIYSNYSQHALLPKAYFSGYKAPEPTIPASVGHHKEWLEAVKNGGSTTCNFEYSGRLAETILLGSVAYRCGQKIAYDAKNMKAIDCPAADKYLNQGSRKGWEV